MTTLAAGNSTTVNLTAGQVLNINPGGAGTAVLGSGQQAGVSYQLGASPVVIGPFSAAQSVSVSASAVITYFVEQRAGLPLTVSAADIGDVPLRDGELPQVRDSNGGLAPAASNGTAYTAAISSLVSVAGILAPNTLAVCGDSRLASWRSVAATISERNPRGYLSWALAYSYERMTVISDQSLGGSQIIGAGTGSEISSTQINAAILSGAGHLLLEGGVNDFFQAGATLAAVQAGYLTILDKAAAAGMRVWIVLGPTVNSAYSAYSVAAQGKLLALNEWLRTRVASTYARKGVVVIDVASKIVDPASATANAQTNFLYDNIHMRNIGAMVAGAEVARVWNLFVPEAPQLLSSNADNQTYSASSTNILDNGLMVAGTTLATGFTSSLTGTGPATTTDSLVARSDGFGNNQRRVIGFTANNDSARMFTGDLKARVSDGDWLVFLCEVIPSAMTATRCIRGQLTLTGASSSLTATTMQLDGTNDLAMTSTTPFLIKTNPIQVNLATLGALTSVQANLAAFASASGGVTLDNGRWSVRKLPTA